MHAARARHTGTVFAFDAARAVAALAVLAAHARSIVLLDAGQQLAGYAPVARLFFGATALGHQAVIVFLVVSGTLVTRSMLAMHAADRWSATTFAAARLTRLWAALLPCLVLGGLEDKIGITLVGPLQTGDYGLPGTSAAAVARHLDLTTFVANVGFLQDFAAPAFGSNLPLWTLAIEAWCYTVAFVLLSLWRERGRSSAVLPAIVLAAAAFLILTPRFWLLFPIWLIGGATAFRQSDRPSGRRFLRTVTLLGMGLAVAANRYFAERHGPAADYLLAVVTACSFVLLADWQPRADWWVRIIRHTADLSYTLYLSHVPLLALLATLCLHGTRLLFGGPALALWLAGCGIALVQGLALWWLFERHTGTLRTVLVERLRGHARGQPAKPRGATS